MLTVIAGDTDEAKLLSPLYVAWSVSVPAGNVVVVNVATPVASVALPNAAPFTLIATVPEGTAVPEVANTDIGKLTDAPRLNTLPGADMLVADCINGANTVLV